MTILLLSQVFPPRTGGSGRWLWELYRRLNGATVHVAAGDVAGAVEFDYGSPLPITRLALDLPSWGLFSVAGVQGYARALTVLHRLVRGCAPDVIHCGKCLPEGLLAVAIKLWKGIPFVCYVHGEELALARTTREFSFLTRRVLRQASLIVANSQHSKEMLMAEWQVAASSIEVLHPGVDTAVFTPAPPDPAARRRFGWEGRRVVLTVGALQKRKGQDMMIRALPFIRSRCPDVLYSIVGQGWEQTYLEELADSNGVRDLVQFRGVPRDARTGVALSAVRSVRPAQPPGRLGLRRFRHRAHRSAGLRQAGDCRGVRRRAGNDAPGSDRRGCSLRRAGRAGRSRRGVARGAGASGRDGCPGARLGGRAVRVDETRGSGAGCADTPDTMVTA